MVTAVGLSPNFNIVLASLITLEHDAIAAYYAAIERFKHPHLRKKLSRFVRDHERHLRELNRIARKLGIDVSNSTDIKVAVTEGKVLLANLMGDQATLMALKSNEDDTVTAYNRAFNHEGLLAIARPVVEHGLADERRHRAWIMDAIAKHPDYEAAKDNMKAA